MNRRINTRVVDTAGAATNTLIERNPTEVYWISFSPQAINTQGLLQLYDGFDVAGKLVWQLEPGYANQENFIPPIHCEQGVFVYTDANIASYTLGYRPKKWDRPKPMKPDVIEHPKA